MSGGQVAPAGATQRADHPECTEFTDTREAACEDLVEVCSGEPNGTDNTYVLNVDMGGFVGTISTKDREACKRMAVSMARSGRRLAGTAPQIPAPAQPAAPVPAPVAPQPVAPQYPAPAPPPHYPAPAPRPAPGGYTYAPIPGAPQPAPQQTAPAIQPAPAPQYPAPQYPAPQYPAAATLQYPAPAAGGTRLVKSFWEADALSLTVSMEEISVERDLRFKGMKAIPIEMRYTLVRDAANPNLYHLRYSIYRDEKPLCAAQALDFQAIGGNINLCFEVMLAIPDDLTSAYSIRVVGM